MVSKSNPSFFAILTEIGEIYELFQGVAAFKLTLRDESGEVYVKRR